MTNDVDPPDPIRVLVVDDQPLLRTGFAMVLRGESDIELIGEAENGRQAIELVRSLEPDVVLMDVRMPELDGIAATEQIRQLERPPAIVILTTFDLDEYVYAALRAGAAGFLLKDARPEELIHAIRVVAGGDAMIAPTVTKRLITAFASLPERSIGEAPGFAELTERETEVLLLMARGMSNAEIADELILGETTIKTHVGRVLMKLGARDRVQAVIAAYEAGLVG